MPPPLAGKRVLVTGSGRGIGLAAAVALLEAGATVMLNAERPLDDLPDVRAVLGTFPLARYRQADVTDDAAADALVDTTWVAFGGVDVLVNNVGTFREPCFLDLTRADFDALFHLNVWAAVRVTQAVVRRAVSAGRGGRVLFTTSLNATRSEPGHTLYDASKGAVNALTRQLAVELASLGFTTAAVAPGLVETPLTDFGLRSDPAARQAVIDQIPLRRIATVDDIAGWFAFLATDAAAYATGTVITVDGGLDAQQMPTRPVTRAERGP